MDKQYKCVNCGKPVPQVANKKHRLYCNDACRIAFKRKAKANNKSEQIKSEQPKIKSEQRIATGRRDYDPHFTSKLTDYEVEHYKPASGATQARVQPCK